ncbi:MAG TPA: helix-turn-helix domain-containing protein, partial [Chloroflexota bacterium]
MADLLDGSLPRSGPAGQAPEYYGVSEAAALLGVNRVTVWRWIAAGRLKVWRAGPRTARIRRADLEQLLGRDGSGRAQTGLAASVGAPEAPPEPAPGEHIVQFYQTDEFLARAVADFVGPGLEADR